jgi:fructan beta-fructosidase
MSNWDYANEVPTSPWRSAMSLPRELTVRRIPEGLRLVQQPVGETMKLRGKRQRLGASSLARANAWLNGLKPVGELLEIAVTFDAAATAGELGLRLLTGPGEVTVLRCEPTQGRLSLDRTHSGQVDFHPKFKGVHEAPVRLPGGQLRLHVFLDRSSLEVFAADGETVLTDLILPGAGRRRLEIFSNSEAVRVHSLEIWELRSTWSKGSR